MLDSLALLLEKAFLFAHFSVLPSGREQDRKLDDEVEVEKERCLQQQQKLQRGDLLEVPRTLFIHFGIYLGDGKVVHLIPDILPAITSDRRRIERPVSNKRLVLGVLYKCATIRVDSLEDFAYGSPVLINTMDAALRKRPLPGDEVALRAEELIGRIQYSLLWNNCEHFVTYCRYGTEISLQTDKFCECLKSIIRDQRSVLVATVFGAFFILLLGLSLLTALPTFLILFTLWMAG